MPLYTFLFCPPYDKTKRMDIVSLCGRYSAFSQVKNCPK